MRWRRSGGLLEQAVELAEPVASPVDVGDVNVVKQAVKDRGGQDLVAGEDLRPVPDVLVGGEGDRALLVPGADEPGEQVGLEAVQRPEAHLVDNSQLPATPGVPGKLADRHPPRLHMCADHDLLLCRLGHEGLRVEGRPEVWLLKCLLRHGSVRKGWCPQTHRFEGAPTVGRSPTEDGSPRWVRSAEGGGHPMYEVWLLDSEHVSRTRTRRTLSP